MSLLEKVVTEDQQAIQQALLYFSKARSLPLSFCELEIFSQVPSLVKPEHSLREGEKGHLS